MITPRAVKSTRPADVEGFLSVTLSERIQSPPEPAEHVIARLLSRPSTRPDIIFEYSTNAGSNIPMITGLIGEHRDRVSEPNDIRDAFLPVEILLSSPPQEGWQLPPEIEVEKIDVNLALSLPKLPHSFATEVKQTQVSKLVVEPQQTGSYVCTVCQKIFTQNKNRLRHMRGHDDGPKRFPCTW